MTDDTSKNKRKSRKDSTKLAECEIKNVVTSVPVADEYSEDGMVPPDEYLVVKDIWSRLQSNELSFETAKIGETFGSGRIIYDYDLIIEILITAGYSVKYALKFIDSMVEGMDDEAPFPIVAISKAKLDIMEGIQKLPGVDDVMTKANILSKVVVVEEESLSKDVE